MTDLQKVLKMTLSFVNWHSWHSYSWKFICSISYLLKSDQNQSVGLQFSVLFAIRVCDALSRPLGAGIFLYRFIDSVITQVAG